MHIPSKRVSQEMSSEIASLWYVSANNNKEQSLLIKAPTPSIKALIAGCPLKLLFGKKDTFFCTGAQILDIPDAPIFISGVQRDVEEHNALIRALKAKKIPLFLFNEMDVCIAWSEITLSDKDAYEILKLLEPNDQLYVGPFTAAVEHALDCFCYSFDNELKYLNVYTIPIYISEITLEPWHVIESHFLGFHDQHAVKIDEKDEGETFEKMIWASLKDVFPTTLYKSPQVKIGNKTRELIDVFSFHYYGSFLIEAKDSSVINSGYHRNQERRIAGVQKQVKKAIKQLVGANKSFKNKETIFDANGYEITVNREQPAHCIILISELMHTGNWEEIELQLLEAIKKTGAFFHLIDLREFISLLKGSSGKPELFDYNLMQRCKLFIEKKSIFIRSEPSIKK